MARESTVFSRTLLQNVFWGWQCLNSPIILTIVTVTSRPLTPSHSCHSTHCFLKWFTGLRTSWLSTRRRASLPCSALHSKNLKPDWASVNRVTWTCASSTSDMHVWSTSSASTPAMPLTHRISSTLLRLEISRVLPRIFSSITWVSEIKWLA